MNNTLSSKIICYKINIRILSGLLNKYRYKNCPYKENTILSVDFLLPILALIYNFHCLQKYFHKIHITLGFIISSFLEICGFSRFVLNMDIHHQMVFIFSNKTEQKYSLYKNCFTDFSPLHFSHGNCLKF